MGRIKTAAANAAMTALVCFITGLGIIAGTVLLGLAAVITMRVLAEMMPVFIWILR
jgi:hypothetical protein